MKKLRGEVEGPRGTPPMKELQKESEERGEERNTTDIETREEIKVDEKETKTRTMKVCKYKSRKCKEKTGIIIDEEGK